MKTETVRLTPERNGEAVTLKRNIPGKPMIDVAYVISPPNFDEAHFLLKGTAPLVQCRFGEKAKQAMRDKHAAGSVAAKGKKREPKDFDRLFKESQHKCGDWNGFPASGFRAAMIDACRLVGFRMTLAKLSIFVEGDGICDYDHIPLVRIDNVKPEKIEHIVRNETGVPDIRVRTMYPIGWTINLRVKFDADQFTVVDVMNLLNRVGQQVGIGEGRHNSKNSYGMGWGTFEIAKK